MNRRQCLGAVAAATLLTRRPGWAAGGRRIDRIGAQLFAVREALERDFEGSDGDVMLIKFNV